MRDDLTHSPDFLEFIAERVTIHNQLLASRIQVSVFKPAELSVLHRLELFSSEPTAGGRDWKWQQGTSSKICPTLLK